MRRFLATLLVLLLTNSVAQRSGVLCERAMSDVPAQSHAGGHASHEHAPSDDATQHHGPQHDESPAHGSPVDHGHNMSQCPLMALCSPAVVGARTVERPLHALPFLRVSTMVSVMPSSLSASPDTPPPKA